MKIPATAAVVVVVEHEGRFLCIDEERGLPQGRVWYFPSGALEPGESIAEAARREVLEEAGSKDSMSESRRKAARSTL